MSRNVLAEGGPFTVPPAAAVPTTTHLPVPQTASEIQDKTHLVTCHHIM